jgi:argininosuccinate lyase
MNDEKKAWGGRFSKPLDAFVTDFGASLPFDRRMAEEDIEGSVAHARMLARTGVISSEDAESICAGLSRIRQQIADGTFEFSSSDEDIHMAIEQALIRDIGAAGGRLHTARSRNDQVALDTRMYAKKTAASLAERVAGLRATLVHLAEKHFGVVMPGYTHLQKAQPVLLSHHLLAYSWMLGRDFKRLRAAFEAADVMPLGSAALAGTTFMLDRGSVAEELGFSSVSPNSLDAVSDRDFVLDLVYASAVAMVHLSRLCEELVLWSSEEFGFVSMDDSFSTGSSIMPQKKNPDVAELVRGKSGRAIGDLTALLVVVKGLPLAYNKDMQEDKEALFDATDTLGDCLRAVDGMVASMTVNADAMRTGALGGFMAATDLADYLAAHGVPFREAHEVVGRLVLECERSGRTLQDLSAAELRAASTSFDEDAVDVLDIDTVVQRRASEGGTGHDAVREQLERARASVEADRAWLATLG